MNIEIKILTTNNTNSKSKMLDFYEIKKIKTLFEERYNKTPNVVFDSTFDKKGVIYLLFGSIWPSDFDKVKKAEENIFYCSAGFNTFGYILNDYKFIGFCDRVNYMFNAPVFYGRKLVSERMNNVKLGLYKIGNSDFYISTNSTEKKGILEFIFDYLDTYVLMHDIA